MGNSMTRATIIWFVGAAVVGAVAGGLHLLRSSIGGAHTGLPLAVSAFALTALAAAMLFHGVMLAAREQDAAAGPAPRFVDEPQDEPQDELARTQGGASGAASVALDPDPDQASSDGPAVYTFRGGKPVGDRSHRPDRRDRSPRS
ncbi:hypothetical protein [Terracoccus sp. 273MFTsu3.1]|uniref:hypothetical protein n=1 Tax=Terracoccus sp. 273MFTsu3.1 TaxID=1172188 RepID=UPI0012DC452B|nr:hypothetical protein [Terracoccus sp. 273MFTsu3.1]